MGPVVVELLGQPLGHRPQPEVCAG
jgi:hypothetical protein